MEKLIFYTVEGVKYDLPKEAFPFKSRYDLSATVRSPLSVRKKKKRISIKLRLIFSSYRNQAIEQLTDFYIVKTSALYEFIRCAGSESLVLLINSLSVSRGNRSIHSTQKNEAFH